MIRLFLENINKKTSASLIKDTYDDLDGVWSTEKHQVSIAKIHQFLTLPVELSNIKIKDVLDLFVECPFLKEIFLSNSIEELIEIYNKIDKSNINENNIEVDKNIFTEYVVLSSQIGSPYFNKNGELIVSSSGVDVHQESTKVPKKLRKQYLEGDLTEDFRIIHCASGESLEKWLELKVRVDLDTSYAFIQDPENNFKLVRKNNFKEYIILFDLLNSLTMEMSRLKGTERGEKLKSMISESLEDIRFGNNADPLSPFIQGPYIMTYVGLRQLSDESSKIYKDAKNLAIKLRYSGELLKPSEYIKAFNISVKEFDNKINKGYLRALNLPLENSKTKFDNTRLCLKWPAELKNPEIFRAVSIKSGALRDLEFLLFIYTEQDCFNGKSPKTLMEELSPELDNEFSDTLMVILNRLKKQFKLTDSFYPKKDKF